MGSRGRGGARSSMRASSSEQRRCEDRSCLPRGAHICSHMQVVVTKPKGIKTVCYEIEAGPTPRGVPASAASPRAMLSLACAVSPTPPAWTWRRRMPPASRAAPPPRPAAGDCVPEIARDGGMMERLRIVTPLGDRGSLHRGSASARKARHRAAGHRAWSRAQNAEARVPFCRRPPPRRRRPPGASPSGGGARPARGGERSGEARARGLGEAGIPRTQLAGKRAHDIQDLVISTCTLGNMYP